MTLTRGPDAAGEARTVQALLGTSLAVSAAIFGYLALARGRVQDPFKLELFRHQLVEQDFWIAALFVFALPFALWPALGRAGIRAAEWSARHPGILAVATTAFLAAGAQFVYRAHPLTMDEYSAVFQSGVFAAGRLAGQLPPELLNWLVPRGYQDTFFKISRETGGVMSIYWPGFTLLLAPFTALGVPWLLNPLIGGATVLVMHRLGRALFGDDPRTGLVVLLSVASPVVTLNAISFYAMPAHLLANALFALFLLQPTPGRALLAGALGSLALVLHNPLPHLLFALPWIVWLALQPNRARLLGALAAGYAPLCLVLGFGWTIYLRGYGSPLAFSDLVTPTGVRVTLTSRLGVFRLPTADVLELRILGLAKVWLWAVPALLAAAVLGAWRWRRDARCRILIGAAVLTYLGFFLVPFDQGYGWGYRYFHAAWLALPLLAVASVPGLAPGADALARFLAACALISLALTGVRLVQVDRYIERHLAQRPEAAGEVRIVIIDQSQGYYAFDLVQNDPFLRGKVITMLLPGPGADEVMIAKHFPQYVLLGRDARGSVWGLPPAAGR